MGKIGLPKNSSLLAILKIYYEEDNWLKKIKYLHMFYS